MIVSLGLNMQIKILNTITLERNIHITLIGDGVGGAKGYLVQAVLSQTRG
jgi:hypothetical protein